MHQSLCAEAVFACITLLCVASYTPTAASLQQEVPNSLPGSTQYFPDAYHYPYNASSRVRRGIRAIFRHDKKSSASSTDGKSGVTAAEGEKPKKKSLWAKIKRLLNLKRWYKKLKLRLTRKKRAIKQLQREMRELKERHGKSDSDKEAKLKEKEEEIGKLGERCKALLEKADDTQGKITALEKGLQEEKEAREQAEKKASEEAAALQEANKGLITVAVTELVTKQVNEREAARDAREKAKKADAATKAAKAARPATFYPPANYAYTPPVAYAPVRPMYGRMYA